MSDDTMIGLVRDILRGIDQRETEAEEGWWDTSSGAHFGTKKLQELETAVRAALAAERERTWREAAQVCERLHAEALARRSGQAESDRARLMALWDVAHMLHTRAEKSGM